MADLQKIVEDRVSQLDSGNKLRDYTAAQAIINAKKMNVPAITIENYDSLGYKERIGKPDADKINQLNQVYQRIKAEWSQIQNQTKMDLGRVKSLFETRKKLTNQEVENSAISKLETANEFKFINTELNKAFTKDLQGHFIEGGLLGMLNNPNTALTKAIKNIGKKYGTDMAEEVKRSLKEISGTAETAQKLLNEGKSGLQKIGEWFASIFGYRRGGQITRYYNENPDFRRYMRNNVMRNLLSGGLAILGFATGGVIYGGMMKTPLKIQSVKTPSKNDIARILYGGGNARDIIQGSIDEIDSYISRGMKSDKVNQANATTIQKGLAEGISIDATRVEHDINQANSSFGEFIDRIPLLGLAFDKERVLRKNMQEYAEIMKNPDPTEAQRSRAIYLNAVISNKLNATRAVYQKRGDNNNRDVAKQTIDDVIAGTRQVVAVEALREGNKLKAFINSHRGYADLEPKLPTRDPIVREAFEAYFTGKSFKGRTGDNLLQYMWENPAVPGVQAMVKAYTTGNTRDRQKYMQTYCTGEAEGETLSTAGTKWGESISNIIRNPDAVSTYISSHNNKYNNLSLTAGYAHKIDQLTNGVMIVAPNAVANAIKSGTYNPNFQGQNTGVRTGSLTEKYNYNGPALETKVLATIDGIRGMLTVGIKPDCTNLVIGKFETSGYNANNPDANILFRIPLLWSIRRGQNSGGKEKRNPENPENPENPHVPTQRVSSQPNGNVIEAPTTPGYNANATETFHQTATNTPVEPGPLAPLTDTVPPAAGSGVPINTNPKW